MNRTKYLLSVFIGVFVYVILSVTVGQNGIKCYSFMENQKRVISKQASDIQNINSELQLELTALQNDKDLIAAYARKLDYVSDGEKLVKITGLKPAQTTLYDIGKVLRHEEPAYLSEKVCKIIGFFFFVITFAIIVLLDISKGKIKFGDKKEHVVTGIPVFDVPQI